MGAILVIISVRSKLEVSKVERAVLQIQQKRVAVEVGYDVGAAL
jgi:hypothetical protein